MRTTLKVALGILLACSATAQADKLCLKVAFNKKKGKVTTSSTVAATCPKGFKELIDTATFVGPAGATGATGATGPQGPQGIAGLLKLDTCKLEVKTGSSCAEGTVCATTLTCGSPGTNGSRLNDLMLDWVFTSDTLGAYVSETVFITPNGKDYPTGIEVGTTSENDLGAHVPSVAIICCEP